MQGYVEEILISIDVGWAVTIVIGGCLLPRCYCSNVTFSAFKEKRSTLKNQGRGSGINSPTPHIIVRCCGMNHKTV